jgi:hypothetical protein
VTGAATEGCVTVAGMQLALAFVALVLTKWFPRTMIVPSVALTVNAIVAAARWQPPDLGPDPFAAELQIGIAKAGVVLALLAPVIALTFAIVRTVEDRRARREDREPLVF